MHLQLGYLAVEHGKLAAKNIQAAVQGKPLKAWKPNGGMSVRRFWLQHSMASCELPALHHMNSRDARNDARIYSPLPLSYHRQSAVLLLNATIIHKAPGRHRMLLDILLPYVCCRR